MEKNNKDNQYEVGYCKPPQATKFQKGQSGNPKGRPKGSKNKDRYLSKSELNKLILNEAQKEIDIRSNNRIKRSTKIEIILNQISNVAAKGDLKAAQIYLNFLSNASKEQEEKQNSLELDLYLMNQHYLTRKADIERGDKITYFDMKLVYDLYKCKKTLREEHGEEEFPYDDFEPITEADWNMFEDHLTDLLNCVEEPRMFINMQSKRFKESRYYQDGIRDLIKNSKEPYASRMREILL